MEKLSRADLMSLEAYAAQRADFRTRVIAHKAHRSLPLGGNVTLLFEDRLTMQYQIQEMLRVERIFEPEGIEDELAAYNPLIPDGANLKATMLIEYPDVDERRIALTRMRGIEDAVWLRADGHDKVYAIADEDMEREDDSKTSSVHFLRFEFTAGMIDALRGGADLIAGIDHPAYTTSVHPVDPATRSALMRDFT